MNVARANNSSNTSIKVTVKGLERAKAEIRRLPKDLQQEARRELGKNVVEHIATRTFDKGRDIHGHPFVRKKEGGASRLLDTGDMRRGVRYDDGRRRVAIIPTQEDKAEAHQYGRGPAYKGWNRKPRTWFGVSGRGETDLNKKTVKHVDLLIKRWAAKSRHWSVRGRGFTGTRPLKVQNDA